MPQTPTEACSSEMTNDHANAVVRSGGCMHRVRINGLHGLVPVLQEIISLNGQNQNPIRVQAALSRADVHVHCATTPDDQIHRRDINDITHFISLSSDIVIFVE